jgi:hypothetical protein
MARASAMVLVSALTACATPADRREEAAFAEIVRAHARRYPALEAPDLYKLAYQAAMGPAHLGLDSTMALEWLEQERPRLDSLPVGGDVLLDTIAPGGRLVRLNLRPFVRAGGELAAVAGGVAGTQVRFVPSRERLRRYFDVVSRLAADGAIAVTADSWAAHLAWMERAGFPPGEHSATYLVAYRPAYRVLDAVAARRAGRR